MRKPLIVKGLRISEARKSLMVRHLHNKINLAIPPGVPYLIYMTIEELQAIIDMNADAAESGCHQAQGQVIEAQAEIDRLTDIYRSAMESVHDDECAFMRPEDDPRIVL
jgi:hypothetical protein